MDLNNKDDLKDKEDLHCTLLEGTRHWTHSALRYFKIYLKLIFLYEAIKEEKNELMATLEKEQGNLSVSHEIRQRPLLKLFTWSDNLQEVVSVKKNIDDVEMAIQKIEQEKTNRNNTIRSLNDEIANQDEVINI